MCGYRVEAGCLVVSGDPVGPDDSIGRVCSELRAFARERGLRIAVVNASEGFASIWREAGLRSLYMGDEAMVGTDFSLEGRAIRKVRQSVNRLERAGYSAEFVRLGTLPRRELGQLEALARTARDERPIDGFSSAMESLRGAHQSDSLLLLARDSDHQAQGFLHFVPCYGRPAASLSTMCHAPATPNGLTEFMVVRALAALRGDGIQEVSLNYAALSRYIHSPRRRHERVLGRVATLLEPLFQIDSLYRFNAKFSPRWQPRFLVYERRGLPRAAVAVLLAEGLIQRVRLRPSPKRLRPELPAPI